MKKIMIFLMLIIALSACNKDTNTSEVSSGETLTQEEQQVMDDFTGDIESLLNSED